MSAPVPFTRTRRLDAAVLIDPATGRVDGNLAAVMLVDGRWYGVDDPTLPQGPDGYLSFLQRKEDGSSILINVAQRDIKAVSYYGVPL